MAFENSVFINCPFDKPYKKLLHPLIFTCIYCGLEPKLSKLTDSGTIRILQILELIRTSKFSIHDISRMKSRKAGELARFNMPFELGLDLGVRATGDEVLATKQCLVIDSEKFRYQAALSDMSGSDISSYGNTNQVENLIRNIRTWFTHVNGPVQPSFNDIYFGYTEFIADLQLELVALNFSLEDIQNLSNSEYIYYVNKWISGRPQ